MKQGLKQHLGELALNALGKGVSRKVVVIESDDWGTVRMSSKKAYERLERKGFGVENCPFNRYDIIETKDDIEDLALVLESVKDRNGSSAKFTLNQIMANPDFLRIKEAEYNEYFFETVYDTYENNNRSGVFQIMKQGVDSKVFEIQFHGREHLNVNQWIDALRNKDELAITAFELGMFSLHNKVKSNAKTEFLEAFGSYDKSVLSQYKRIIENGLELFQKFWGRSPDSFIAPCYIWPSELEDYLFEGGVGQIQSSFVQRHPHPKRRYGWKKLRHFQGERNKNDQLFAIRNVLFEPSIDPSKDWVNTALKQVDCAFTFRKPAIVSSHRLNYVGSLDGKNKSINLGLLHKFLRSVLKKYKDVTFLTSSELMTLYNAKK